MYACSYKLFNFSHIKKLKAARR
jgi:hypothetical protein